MYILICSTVIQRCRYVYNKRSQIMNILIYLHISKDSAPGCPQCGSKWTLSKASLIVFIGLLV